MKEDKSLSESPSKKLMLTKRPESQMDFPDAMRAVIEGRQITKLEWDDPDSICELRGQFLMIRRDNTWYKWLINDGDMFGQDWVVVP